jgi:hypothetical protein
MAEREKSQSEWEVKTMSGEKPGGLKADRHTFLKIAGASTGGAALIGALPSFGVQGHYPNLAERRLAHEKAGIISPEKTYRMMEWGCHTPPQEDFNINVEGAVKAAQDAGAEGLMFYTQGHWRTRFILPMPRCATLI